MTTCLPEIITIIRQVLRDQDVALTEATVFDNLPGWDSMDLVSVVVEVECRCGVRFELPEIDRIATLGDLLAMTCAKQALAAA